MNGRGREMRLDTWVGSGLGGLRISLLFPPNLAA